MDEFNFVTFDYTGYGYSDKAKCTLGPKEMDDLETVIEYVREEFKFKRIYIWGRSMGAVTAVLLARRSANRICQGLLLDSPYSSTKEMLCNVMEKVPNFLLYMLFIPLGSKLKRETGYDMMDTNLNEVVPHVTIPAMFSVAEGDTLAGVKNVQNLYVNYGTESLIGVKRQFVRFPGDHSSNRDDSFLREGRGFLESIERDHLLIENSYSPSVGIFSAHRKLMAIHGLNSPRRLKKSDRCIEIGQPSNQKEDLSQSIEEFFPDSKYYENNSPPMKVRAIPEVESKLNNAKGDSFGLMEREGRKKVEDDRVRETLGNSRFGSLQTSDFFQNGQDKPNLSLNSSPGLNGSKLAPNKTDLDIRAIFADLAETDSPVAYK